MLRDLYQFIHQTRHHRHRHHLHRSLRRFQHQRHFHVDEIQDFETALGDAHSLVSSGHLRPALEIRLQSKWVLSLLLVPFQLQSSLLLRRTCLARVEPHFVRVFACLICRRRGRLFPYVRHGPRESAQNTCLLSLRKLLSFHQAWVGGCELKHEELYLD